MRGFSTFPCISSINSKYKRSHSLCGPPLVIMKKEMTELENKIKLLKLKIAKTEEIIHKQERPALERRRLSISSLASAVDELKLKIMRKGKSAKARAKKKSRYGMKKLKTILRELITRQDEFMTR